MILKIPDNDWKKIFFQLEFSPIFLSINDILNQRDKNFYPEKDKIFRAFETCSFKNLKVIILGQDPYHNKGQADGLAFSVPEKILLPPSLKNIYRELHSDLNIKNMHGDLSSWAQQGVLLLNTCLTVEEDKANSHGKIGWHSFTNKIIEFVSLNKNNLIFILWGKQAQTKKQFIQNKKNHLILESPHPSPLSAYQGFFNCNHFSKTNHYLTTHLLKKIEWKIP